MSVAFYQKDTNVRRAALLNILLVFAVGCTRSRSATPEQPSRGQAQADFPGFRVDVTLSDKAHAALIAKKETVIVIAMYTGVPTPEARRTHNYEMGEVGLGEARTEVMPEEIVRFGMASFDLNALEQSDKKNPQLLINVVSGRKSSENNLLECDLYEGSLAAVQLKSIPISCSLIEENAPSSYIKQSQLKA